MSTELQRPQPTLHAAGAPLGDGEESANDQQAYDAYRTLSVAAVATLILAVLGLLMLPVFVAFSPALIVPAVGTALGVFAVWNVYSRRDEFTGQRMATVGLCISAVVLLAGAVGNLWFNRVEVPAEYEGKQVWFWELQPEEPIDIGELARLRMYSTELPLPQRALELNGQEIFITGYVYPGQQRNSLKEFVLVPDMGQCCFGGQPKLTDMIEVKLADPLRADYDLRRRGIGGVLTVHHNMQSRKQLTGVVYELNADYISP
ncbi:MAG: DUF3299 domain-containing protein [Planctomycetales bacterium]|nr:DUF3299 domain-containing protein [Planctomycetales bacterium]